MTKKEQRIKKLTEYLQRLGAGEELEEVRKDFIKEFSDVQASEIMEAEQELMRKCSGSVMCMQHCFTVLRRKKR